MLSGRRALPGLLLLTACSSGSAEPPRPQDVRQTISAELHASADAWNRGDLDGFLATYRNAPETTFGGATGFARGLDQVRESYQRSYWRDGPPSDSLSFDILEVRMLDEHAALVLGRYLLTPPGRTPASTGYFSLVYRLFDEGWRIVHDHSSASP